jgi:acyl-CoA thioesterase-2
MVCSFHVPEGADEIVEPMPDDAPPPDAMPPDSINTLGGSFEIRREVFEGDGPLQHRFGPRLWVRAVGPLPDDPMLHDCLLFYATDLGSPWDAEAPAPLRPRTSLDHAIWAHRPTRMEEWHHVDLRAGALADARGHYTGQMWHHDGTHVASIAQENLVRA